MTTIRTARRFIRAAPREAVADALGLAAIAALVFAGFLVPALV